jgi:hypothetical protein
MRHLTELMVYISLSVTVNKAVLKWIQVCQLHLKTQLHEISTDLESLKMLVFLNINLAIFKAIEFYLIKLATDF